MLTVTPIPAPGGTFTIPTEALAAVGLPPSRRRFLTPSDAVQWFLTVRW
jgi:hypothetical protein